MIDREKRKQEVYQEIVDASIDPGGDHFIIEKALMKVAEKIVECEQDQETLAGELIDLAQDVHNLQSAMISGNIDQVRKDYVS